jgi:hypothetical protein
MPFLIAFLILQISSVFALELPIILPLEKFQRGAGMDTALSLHIFEDERGINSELATYSFWKTVPMQKIGPVTDNILLSLTSSAGSESLDGIGIHIEFERNYQNASLEVQINNRDYSRNYFYNGAYHVWALVNKEK